MALAAWEIEPLAQIQHLVAEHLGFLRVVGDQQHRHPQASLQLVQLTAHVRAQQRVEGGKGLVQQQRPGFGNQRACQRGALALPARQLRRQLLGHRTQLESIQPVLDGRLAVARARVEQPAPQAEGDVLAHVEVREQRVVLEQVGHLAALRWQVDARGLVEQRGASQADVALIGTHQPGDGLEQQALARAGGAENHQPLAVTAQADLKVEAAISGAQGLADIQIELHGRFLSDWRCVRGPGDRQAAARRCTAPR